MNELVSKSSKGSLNMNNLQSIMKNKYSEEVKRTLTTVRFSIPDSLSLR